MIGKTNPAATRLRRDATDAERLLWQRLRNRQVGGLKFRRQATVGPYVVDFLCVERKLVVEADGGQHGELRDARRTKFLERLGLEVLRFWNHDILGNPQGVLESIAMAAAKRNEKEPSPNPRARAGEGFEGAA